ncbi:MAG: arylsulfatase [Opitutaceae bacterium]|nr:arylsulfatase [Opitutaceae bacterium]
MSSRILLLLYLILSLFAMAGCSSPSSRKSERPPNIIYILADDMGYGDLGCWGQQRFDTPHIDALASGGMRFTQHYSGSTVCAPSRSSLMTGLHTGHTPIRGNKEIQPEGQEPLPAETVTLPEVLKRNGYATGAFGKWGLGPPGSEGDPIHQGFDEFFGYNCQRYAHNYYPYHLWHNDHRVELKENAGNAEGVYAPELIQEKTLAFIEQNQNEPFFLFVPHVIPHAEMIVPEEYMARFRGKFLPESSFDGTDFGEPRFRIGPYGSQTEAHAAFVGMVTMLDDHVGQIVAKINEFGLAEDTLIIFTTDNGPHQEGGHNPDYFDSNGPLRGYKRDLYEGGIRVPMIAKWPGTINANTESDHISAFWDILPTLAEAAGIELSEPVDGISFIPTLTGKGTQTKHDFLYWEFHERGGRQAIRKGNWKGVKYDINNIPGAKLELYDLSKDIDETTNLVAEFPDVVEELEFLLNAASVPSPIEKFNFNPPIK